MIVTQYMTSLCIFYYFFVLQGRKYCEAGQPLKYPATQKLHRVTQVISLPKQHNSQGSDMDG